MADDYMRSVLLRLVRALLCEKNARPPGDVRILWYARSPKLLSPFAALYGNPGKTLVLWPARPSGANAATSEKGCEPFDHLTLDLRNRKTHLTGFAGHANRSHGTRGLRLHEFRGNGVALWCMCAVRWAVIEQECGEFEWNVRMPESDEHRRTQKFTEYARRVLKRPVPVPLPELQGDYVLSAFYVLDSRRTEWFSSGLFPTGKFRDNEVDGWIDGQALKIRWISFSIGSVRVAVVSAGPPGHLKHDVSLYVPGRRDAINSLPSK